MDQIAEFDDFFAFLSFCNGGKWKNVYDAFAFGAREYELQACLAVDDGVGVRDGADGGKSSRGGSPGACVDSFLVFTPRLAEVGVNVYETRADESSSGIYDPALAGDCQIATYMGNAPIRNMDGNGIFPAVLRVNYACVLDK
jgi:hypothetical protein